MTLTLEQHKLLKDACKRFSRDTYDLLDLMEHRKALTMQEAEDWRMRLDKVKLT